MSKPNPSFDERRQAIRSKRILSIQFRLIKGRNKKRENTDWHISTTIDMSSLGVSFAADTAYAIGDILEMQMVMSGVIDIYKGFGQVVRIEQKKEGIFLIAVKFIEGRGK